MEKNFKVNLHESIKRCLGNHWHDNRDHHRFGSSKNSSFYANIKDATKEAIHSSAIYRKFVLATILRNESELQWLYNILEDVESKNLLIELLSYRVLGHRKVKLPLNNPEYWSKLEMLDQKADSADSIDIGLLGWKLVRHNLAFEDLPIQVYARASGVLTQMILQQYRCIAPDHVIEVAGGDTVIDAGGCYGDTALYFSCKAGDKGRVFSFEFMSDNIKVFERNLELNPGLAKRIEVVTNPLWSSTGQKLYVQGVGPGASVSSVPKSVASQMVETLKIDDFVSERQLANVDFIKMDIEGAEAEALKGAEETIRRCRPKLAISVYHSLADFWRIPQWIDRLGSGYRFYLRHFTIHAEETVLFAEAHR